ncbi:MAG: nucleotide exchange factor GrpE [Ilumatobacteraceae bacterium]|jgi:molecular chaperone GrpE
MGGSETNSGADDGLLDEIADPGDERGSEVEDFTGEVPRTESSRSGSVGDYGAGDSIDVSDLDDLFDDPSDGDGDGSDAVAHDVDELLSEIERFKDMAMRAQADFENFRKRSSAQLSDEVERATGRLAEAFLPVLDAAEAAYVRHPDEVGPLLNLMLTELKRHGLETLDIVGSPFDPEVAEAVAHEADSGGDVVVAEVMRSGYRWKGRTLRPAMVRTKD